MPRKLWYQVSNHVSINRDGVRITGVLDKMERSLFVIKRFRSCLTNQSSLVSWWPRAGHSGDPQQRALWQVLEVPHLIGVSKEPPFGYALSFFIETINTRNLVLELIDNQHQGRDPYNFALNSYFCCPRSTLYAMLVLQNIARRLLAALTLFHFSHAISSGGFVLCCGLTIFSLKGHGSRLW